MGGLGSGRRKSARQVVEDAPRLDLAWLMAEGCLRAGCGPAVRFNGLYVRQVSRSWPSPMRRTCRIRRRHGCAWLTPSPDPAGRSGMKRRCGLSPPRRIMAEDAIGLSAPSWVAERAFCTGRWGPGDLPAVQPIAWTIAHSAKPSWIASSRRTALCASGLGWTRRTSSIGRYCPSRKGCTGTPM